MSSGILSNGLDLDAILLARTHAARANANIETASEDTSQRYESITFGTGPANPTGIQSAGIDCNALYASEETGAFSVSISQYPHRLPATAVTLNFGVVTTSGGTPPYTYSWSVVNVGGAGSFYIVGSTTSSTCSVYVAPGYEEILIGNVYLAMTDSASRVANASSHITMDAS